MSEKSRDRSINVGIALITALAATFVAPWVTTRIAEQSRTKPSLIISPGGLTVEVPGQKVMVTGYELLILDSLTTKTAPSEVSDAISEFKHEAAKFISSEKTAQGDEILQNDFEAQLDNYIYRHPKQYQISFSAITSMI